MAIKIQGSLFPEDERNGILDCWFRGDPVFRRRDSGSGSATEHANLASDGKRKGARLHTEAESSDAPERGGPTRGSDEGPVMGLERRGGVTEAWNSAKWETTRSLGKCEHPAGCSRWHEPYDGRLSRTVL